MRKTGYPFENIAEFNDRAKPRNQDGIKTIEEKFLKEKYEKNKYTFYFQQFELIRSSGDEENRLSI